VSEPERQGLGADALTVPIAIRAGRSSPFADLEQHVKLDVVDDAALPQRSPAQVLVPKR